MDLAQRRARFDRYERIADWPMTAASLVFLGAYSWEVIGQLSGRAQLAADLVLNAMWLLFVVDYVIRLVLAPERWRWFRRHLLDLAIVALPVLQQLRLLRLVTVLQVLQRRAGAVVRGRVVVYTVVASLLLIYIAALAILQAEREAGTITTLGDALWWAFVTVTTVGYGDFFPVTVAGRLIAVGLMIGGIALIGVVTATVASWIVERVSGIVEGADDATDDAPAETPVIPGVDGRGIGVEPTAQEVALLRAEMAELRELLAASRH